MAVRDCVWNCACDLCRTEQAAGRMPPDAPVRDCKTGPQCPCHAKTCGGRFSPPAVSTRRSLTPPAAAVGSAEVWNWLRIGGALAALVVVGKILLFVGEAVGAVVGWVSSNVAAILVTAAVLGGIGGATWFLFLNPAKPLSQLGEMLAERARRRREWKAAARALPPPQPVDRRALPPPQVTVLGFTVDPPREAVREKGRVRK